MKYREMIICFLIYTILNNKSVGLPPHTIRMAIIKKTRNNKWRGCGEKGTLSTIGGNIKWCGHYGKQYGGSSKKQKKELPDDPAISLLGIYLKKTKTLI